MTLLLATLALLASERIEIRNGHLPAPGLERCIRLHAAGTFRDARVVVNGVTAGTLANSGHELDITGYLSLGAPNTVKIEGYGVDEVWAVIGPLVYIETAKLVKGGRIEVTVVNTTENTAQVEIGGQQQFTVSPGTSAAKQFPWPAGVRKVGMRAMSDGLDREFQDEVELPPEPR